MKDDKIYTHDIASEIVERFETLLIENKMRIPSPEDDQRDPEDQVGLYGSVYSNLLDNIESELVCMLKKCKAGGEIITDQFSGTT